MRIYHLLIPCLLAAGPTAAQSAARLKKDSLAVHNKELVIRNASRKTDKGFVFNEGNGVTAFRKTGIAFQFKVGAANAPAAGTQTFQRDSLRQSAVKVWRNGLLQENNAAAGIQFNKSTGTITFIPVLAANDKIYIEALQAMEEQ